MCYMSRTAFRAAAVGLVKHRTDILSRIDNCNSLLFGSTHEVTSRLQRMQNYAARVILRLPKSSIICH